MLALVIESKSGRFGDVMVEACVNMLDADGLA